jgi:tRNA threonylcarbamoyladenosine biosynthesis protein TsaB
MTGFRCLAIETATNVCSVAACNGDETAQLQLEDSRSSSRQLYLSLKDVLARVNLVVDDIDCIAFGCGPGSFTGVRVAAAAAQGLAYAQSVPVCRVSTLAALAAVARRQSGADNIAVNLDARMGEAYVASYRFNNAAVPEAIIADSLIRPDDPLVSKLAVPGSDWLPAGNGWAVFPEMAAAAGVQIAEEPTEIWPDALAVVDFAREQFAAGTCIAADAALPNYLRNKVTY